MDNWLCVHCNIILPLTYQHTHLIAVTIVSQITFSILANTILQFGQTHFVSIVTSYSHTGQHAHSTLLCGSLKHVSASTSSRLASLFQQQQTNLFLTHFSYQDIHQGDKCDEVWSHFHLGQREKQCLCKQDT